MTKIFQSNETLEMCDVRISENGGMVVETKSFHSAEMSRLGKPSKTIRGRVKMEDTSFVFEPYAEATRKLTYQKQVVVGGTTLAVTDDKVKISFMVPRHLTKNLMLMYVQSEMDEVKRRLEEDLYESLVVNHKNDNVNDNSHPDRKVNVNVSVNVEQEGGAA